MDNLYDSGRSNESNDDHFLLWNSFKIEDRPSEDLKQQTAQLLLELRQGSSFEDLLASTDHACSTNFLAPVQETFIRRVYEFWEASEQYEQINFYTKRMNTLQRFTRIMQFINQYYSVYNGTDRLANSLEFYLKPVKQRSMNRMIQESLRELARDTRAIYREFIDL